ncbi:MAG: hypothetical protein AAF639_23865 [Chloroflexota bacterium]
MHLQVYSVLANAIQYAGISFNRTFLYFVSHFFTNHITRSVAASLILTIGFFVALQPNVASAKGVYTGHDTVRDVANDHISSIDVAMIRIEKLANGQEADVPNGPDISVGDTILLEYVITNVGDEALQSIIVRDSDLGDVTLACPQTELAELASMVCNVVITAEEGINESSATVTATTADGTLVTHADGVFYRGVRTDLAISQDDNLDEIILGSLDNLEYTISFENQGPGDAIDVVIVNNLPAGVTLNEIVRTSPDLGLPSPQGSIDDGLQLVWRIRRLSTNETGEIVFSVNITSSLAGSTIKNQVTIVSDTPDVDLNDNQQTRDTDVPLNGVAVPTAIMLADFKATILDDGLNGDGMTIQVMWHTLAEIQTKQFDLYRSTTGDFEDAVLVNEAPVLAKGDPQDTHINANDITADITRGDEAQEAGFTDTGLSETGLSETEGNVYIYQDTSVVNGPIYTYWLVEEEVDGTRIEYGPVTASVEIAGQSVMQLFLPIILHE